MFKLPFGYLPGHWGLAGKTKEIAKAEYELTGYDLERRLLELTREDLDLKEYTKRHINLNFKHGKITESDHVRQHIALMDDEKLKSKATLELDHKEGKIGELEYAKAAATLNDEPWVTVINMDFAGAKSLEGSFELDWNEQFVKKLMSDGYVGASPDTIVNQWFMEVCRNVAMEEFDGTGDFTADSEANLDAVKRWSNPEPIGKTHKGYK